jgi:hypothetical protein
MKNFKNKVSISVAALLLLLVIGISCKDTPDELNLSRVFAPSGFSRIAMGETQVQLDWNPSLFTLPGEVEYIIEIDSLADFSHPVFSDTIADPTIVVTNETLKIKKDHYARVKAISLKGTDNSNWTMSTAFRILGEQFLLDVPPGDIIDNKVILRWKTNPSLTKIVITRKAGGPSVVIPLTATDLTAQQKLVSNLTPSTAYTAEIFQDSKSKGTKDFTTKAAIVGASIIDLRSKTGRPSILTDTLPVIPNGSTVILNRTQTYTLATSVTLSKSVTIVSGLDFGNTQAIIKSTSSFNLAAGSVIDSIVFQDVQIRGGNVKAGAPSLSFDTHYLLNAASANPATVTKIRLENCVIKMLRGVVRGQGGGTGTKFGTYIVNNCVIDSLKDFGIAAVAGASAFADIKITNTTVYRAVRFIVHALPGNSSVLIQNCTFNELVAGPPAPGPAAVNYFMDFSTTAGSGGVTIKNTVFGAVWDIKGGTNIYGYRAKSGTTPFTVDNTFNTSDFVNNLTGTNINPIPGLVPYSGSSTTLFTDPTNGNFKIKDANFPGKGTIGDPRWR